MEENMTFFNGFGVILALVSFVVALTAFGYAIFEFISARNPVEPGLRETRMRRFELGLASGFVALAVLGAVLVIPGIISRVIIEPSGGTALSVEGGGASKSRIQYPSGWLTVDF